MKYNQHFALLFIIVFGTFLLAASPASAVNLFGVQCDPSKPPNAQNTQNDPNFVGGCDADDFLEVVRHVIIEILKILLIVAPIMIAAGGIMIMTAAGSESRVGTGKKIITAAVIGIAIGLGSYLIIEAIYIALKGVGGTPPVPVENVTIP